MDTKSRLIKTDTLDYARAPVRVAKTDIQEQMMTDDSLTPVLTQIDAGLPDALERLMDLLRIPSISTDPAFAPDCDRAADWLVSKDKALLKLRGRTKLGFQIMKPSAASALLQRP